MMKDYSPRNPLPVEADPVSLDAGCELGTRSFHTFQEHLQVKCFQLRRRLCLKDIWEDMSINHDYILDHTLD